MKLRSLSVLFILIVSIFIVPLNSQLKLDLPDLVNQSSLIVRTKVIALSAQWITDQNGKQICTTAHLEPIKALNYSMTASSSGEWLNIGFVSGNGTSNQPHSYYDTDNSVISSRYAYRVKQIEQSGIFKYSYDTDRAIGVPSAFALNQNFPNPFNPKTNISYSISEVSNKKIFIFDVLGREVIALLNKEQQPGYYNVDFDASK